ncbi:MAG: hypothetical protein AB2L14_31130 [Candidatus Xenobiia bacterium LiM19]
MNKIFMLLCIGLLLSFISCGCGNNFTPPYFQSTEKTGQVKR